MKKILFFTFCIFSLGSYSQHYLDYLQRELSLPLFDKNILLRADFKGTQVIDIRKNHNDTLVYIYSYVHKISCKDYKNEKIVFIIDTLNLKSISDSLKQLLFSRLNNINIPLRVEEDLMLKDGVNYFFLIPKNNSLQYIHFCDSEFLYQNKSVYLNKNQLISIFNHAFKVDNIFMTFRNELKSGCYYISDNLIMTKP